MIPTLIFTYCESNLITLVFKNFRNDLNIGFQYCESNSIILVFQKLRKQSQHWFSHITKATQSHGFLKTSKTFLALAFVHYESNSNTFVVHSPFTIHL